MLEPDFSRAEVSKNKITDYLLCTSHKDGAGKAKFFLSFGFEVENWSILADALLRHASQGVVTSVVESPTYGVKYVVEGRIDTPSGRVVSIESVWIIDNDDATQSPRLVTAVPK